VFVEALAIGGTALVKELVIQSLEKKAGIKKND
jgi:hypothetical protein